MLRTLRSSGAGFWLTAATAVLSLVVWLVRLEARIQANDAAIEAHEKAQAEINRTLREDLTYIRERIDRALEGPR